MANLFDGIDQVDPSGAELVERLASGGGARVERIVSLGHSAPDEGWFDQGQPEWVVVVQGAARLRFDDEAHDRRLGPGDWLMIDARRRHRVTWTDPDQPTVWLAVFFD